MVSKKAIAPSRSMRAAKKLGQNVRRSSSRAHLPCFLAWTHTSLLSCSFSLSFDFSHIQPVHRSAIASNAMACKSRKRAKPPWLGGVRTRARATTRHREGEEEARRGGGKDPFAYRSFLVSQTRPLTPPFSYPTYCCR